MRTPAAIRKPAKVASVNFPAPTGGWIANRSLAIGRSPQLPPGASVLDNFFPTSTGIILRRGSERRYSIGSGPVLSMFRYVSGNQSQLFASVDGTIHDVSTSTASEVYASGTNGDWHVQQFTTAGGTFLIGVNGTDTAFVYDGIAFAADAAITFPSGVGLTTADLAYVWSYASRLWFIEKDSMNVWYLPVDQIGGELTLLPLGGVFTLGGSLVWGQTWSLSSGGSGGLSDQCVFTSTEGEVLAYQGNNPASASTWSKVGLYRIGEPMGREAFVRAGGDLLIATTVGMVSLAEASKRDYAALGSSAASYPIEEAWTSAIAMRGTVDWRCLVWPEGKMVIVTPPRGVNDSPANYIANSNTGAWCRFTEWDIASLETFNGQLHFGDRDGALWVGNVTGVDDGDPYVGVCIPLYDDMSAPAARKIARNGRVVKRTRFATKEKLTAIFDFSTRTPAAPTSGSSDDTSVWGTGIWGESAWGEEQGEIVTGEWRSLGGSGQDVSVCLQVTSGDLVPLDAELIRIDALYEFAGIVS